MHTLNWTFFWFRLSLQQPIIIINNNKKHKLQRFIGVVEINYVRQNPYVLQMSSGVVYFFPLFFIFSDQHLAWNSIIVSFYEMFNIDQGETMFAGSLCQK